jgi:hypothetical protein
LRNNAHLAARLVTCSLASQHLNGAVVVDEDCAGGEKRGPGGLGQERASKAEEGQVRGDHSARKQRGNQTFFHQHVKILPSSHSK